MRIWLVACILVAFGGCAHTCRDPEIRAAEHGAVLECKKVLVYKNGKRVVRCLVSTPSGDQQFHYGACE